MRLGILQSDGAGLDADARLDLLDRSAAGQGFDLLVTPELFQSGYNRGGDIADLAQAADGPFMQAVARIAARHRCGLCVGLAETDNGALFNAAIVLDAGGRVVAHHRKRVLPPGFERDLFRPGTRHTTFEMCGIRCELVICYEVEFPETARAAALGGADLLLAPTALGAQWPIVARAVVPSRAFENGLWVAYANHAGAERGLGYLGESCIIAPDGSEAARAGAAPDVIAASIDRGAVQAARARLPYLTDRDGLANPDAAG